MKNSFPPDKLIKKIDRIIFNKYTGFSLLEIDDYILIKIKSLQYILKKNDLENIKISINQENLYKLELERKNKKEDKFHKFSQFADARLEKKDNIFRVKMRLKGDRSIHWEEKNKSSYKVDIKGEKRLWGLEEFSIQKPVTRNYIYEFIFHKLLEFNNLISLKYFFVNLSVNDTDQGIYAVEEGFSKELIERNKKRNGPIFGLNEEDGVEYPNIFYDLYSKNYWIENYPDLTKKAFAKLNQLKLNENEINEIFDLKKWAKFFAVIDFSNALHGSLSKSVKLYYNPVTGKFEPIGFDGHFYELNPANNFIILDFLNPKNNNCNHICYDRSWYLKFLKNNEGEINNEFVNLYIKELENISSDNFLKDFNKEYVDKINFYTSQFYSEKSNKDRALYKGLGYFIYDDKYLEKRKKYIQKRVKNIENNENLKFTLDKDKIKFYSQNKFELKQLKTKCGNQKLEISYVYPNSSIKFDKNCEYLINKKKLDITSIPYLNSNFKNTEFLDLTNNKNLVLENGKYYLNNDLEINQNVYFPKDNQLIIKEGVKISFKNIAILASEGSIYFEGTEKNPIIIDGNKSGSVILSNNKYKIEFTKLKNLINPKIDDKILYGGINIIESFLEINNLDIKNSLSEDAINIISSDSVIDNLRVTETFSDAIDVDFGKINFSKIYCENINNDCFDISGGEVLGDYLEANNVRDKGISFGEESKGSINFVNLKNNFLGIAVKDGSELLINEGNLIKNEFDVSVFQKKNEFGKARLVMNKSNKIENLKALVGKKSEFTYDKSLKFNKVNNEFIYNLFY